jgi:hypothetical protein
MFNDIGPPLGRPELVADSSLPQAHVPTSALLSQLVAETPPRGVTLAWVLGRLENRSFALLLLLLALLSLAPGVASVTALLFVFPAVQMILGRPRPSLPGLLSSRAISARRFAQVAAMAIPIFKRLERIVRPRLQTMVATTRPLVGFVILLRAATMIWPVPFSHIVPAVVIALIAFAYLEEDGALLGASLVGAVVSVCISATIVWATLEAAEFFERLIG